MEILKKLRAWLRTYPKWDAGGLTYIDFTDGMPGNTALYPQGMEEMSRIQDVTGNIRVVCRWNFLLVRIGLLHDDGATDAEWMLEFQQWVQQQSALGLTPVFGEEPELENISVRKGRQQKVNESGTVSYSAELSVTFVKHYLRQ